MTRTGCCCCNNPECPRCFPGNDETCDAPACPVCREEAMISPSDDLTLGGRVVPRQHPLADVLADIRVLAADLTARYADDTPPLDVTTAIHNARTLLRRAAEINNKEAI